jgi:S-adenosylmethionine uptake transporter
MQSLWMLFASFTFAAMGVCVKLASEIYTTSEIVLCRGVIGVSVLFCMIRIQGGSFKTTMPLAHLWRGFIGVISLWLWFYAIANLPLATACTAGGTPRTASSGR